MKTRQLDAFDPTVVIGSKNCGCIDTGQIQPLTGWHLMYRGYTMITTARACEEDVSLCCQVADVFEAHVACGFGSWLVRSDYRGIRI